MQFCVRSCLLENGAKLSKITLNFQRNISHHEISTALRPFYFAVHPDLFGRFPEQREINENSLKLLSAHIEALTNQNRILPGPASIPFYLKPEKKNKNSTLKLKLVPLEKSTDTKIVLRRILEACELSTDYVDKLQSRTSYSPRRPMRKKSPNRNPNAKRYNYEFGGPEDSRDDFEEDFEIFRTRVYKKKEDESLNKWIRKNLDIAQIRTKNLDDLKEEIEEQKTELAKKLKLKNIIYDCGWDFGHFKGCLKSLETLHNLYGNDMKNLENKTVIFGSFTGVSLTGEIILFTGDVQNNWLDFIKSIPKQEIYLSAIPMYENTLSQVLRNIKIVRRRFMPKSLAKSYSSHLKRLITTLLDYLTRTQFPEAWPDCLEEFELVVESESGPLMLSPVGQLITPSTIPGVIFIDFITKNLDAAKVRQDAYKKSKYVEIDLLKKCKKQLELSSIVKDDSITADQMISCMEKLLASDIKLKNLNLFVSNYYSIFHDGTISIPHNFNQ